VTEDERSLLGVADGVEVSKATTAEVNEILGKCIGKSLDDFGENAMKFDYLEAYDAYYTYASDTMVQPITVLSGYKDADGLIHVIYTGRLGDGKFRVYSDQNEITVHDRMEVCLKEADGEYKIASNQVYDR